MASPLRIEELEERIAPTVIAAGGNLEFEDADGDQIRISYWGPAGSQADVTDAGDGDIENGDTIGLVNIADGDWTSVLLLENLGGGDGRTEILKGVQSETDGAGIGVIALGVGPDGSDAGEVDLASEARILVDGSLGMLVINGDVDFEGAGGHIILAEGDIGLVEVRGDMALDPSVGAKIFAGDGFATGDISFISVGGAITDGQSDPHSTIDVGAGFGSHTFKDDVGSGASGSLAVNVLGTGATGQLTLIPIADGGAVLSRLEVSDGASVAVTASGDGGDVTEILSSGSIGRINIYGVNDTDLYSVSAAGIGKVHNRTIGGDIAAVHSAADIGRIQTRRLGSLGSVFTGATNSIPLLVAAQLAEGDGTEAAGAISYIKVGGVVNTDITASSLLSLVARPGGISGVDIDVSGDIGTVESALIEGSHIYAGTGIGSVEVGAAGIVSSTIESPGGINLVSTGGAIRDSLITAAQFEGDPVAVSGAGIGRIRAGSVHESSFRAFSGFGSVKVKRAFVDSSVEARFYDESLDANVGGPIGSFRAGGMYLDSSVLALTDISRVSIGVGGVVQSSIIDAAGTLQRVSVRGDVADDSIIAAGAGIGTVSISGDLAFDSRISSSGNLAALTIGGGIIGGDVLAAGNLGRLVVEGGISGVGVSIGVGGRLGLFSVTGGIYGVDRAFMDVVGDLDKFDVTGGVTRLWLTVGGSVESLNAAAGGTVLFTTIDINENLSSARMKASDSTLLVGGDLGSLRIRSDAPDFIADIEGDTDRIAIRGGLTHGEITLEGDVGVLRVGGELNNSTIIIGADDSPVSAGAIRLGGSVGSTALDVWGDVGRLSVKGSVVYSGVEVSGDASEISVGRGVYGCYLRVHGSADTFTVGNSIHDSQTLFDDGVSEYTVGGSIYNVNIGNQDWIDGQTWRSETHAPLGTGAIGKLSAYDINGAHISANGGIGRVVVQGTIYDSVVEALGDDGAGASIGRILARGLDGTEIAAYNAIGALVLGDGGIGSGSTVTTDHGDLGTIRTAGLIYGDVTVGGYLTGPINSAGTNAVDLGTDVDLYFCDANGTLTGGTLTLANQDAGDVTVS